MPITLVTGLPGHGKTLYSLVRWKELAEREGRPVFHSSGLSADGIPGLSLPWQAWDPLKWFQLPAKALMLMDECQRVFPIRGRGADVPEHVRQLETHRHLGLDLVLITQDPMLIDPHVRRLVDRHFHVVRSFGMERATVHEYVNGVRDMVSKSRGDSIRHTFSFPKSAYAWYRSAEVHTVKRRIPVRAVLMLAAPLVALGAAGWFYLRTDARLSGELEGSGIGRVEAGAAGGDSGSLVRSRGGVGGPGGAGALEAAMTPQEFARFYHPRVPGLAHTAPAFDQVTAPVVAPYPAACVASASRCHCYSQQATRLDVPAQLCRQIAAGGFFVAWQVPGAASAPATVVRPPDPPMGGGISLGGTPPGDRAAPPSRREPGA